MCFGMCKVLDTGILPFCLTTLGVFRTSLNAGEIESFLCAICVTDSVLEWSLSVFLLSLRIFQVLYLGSTSRLYPFSCLVLNFCMSPMLSVFSNSARVWYSFQFLRIQVPIGKAHSEKKFGRIRIQSTLQGRFESGSNLCTWKS
jgi:hypothetical protein